MESNLSNNKRIAKNTLFLYLRQFFVLGISIYTSRVILSALGVVDYGIYDVIGGLVALVATVNFAMMCATTRFLTFQLGRDDNEHLNEAYSNSIIIHSIIAIFIIIVGELLGPYCIVHYLTIPMERLDAAQWCLQYSIFACAIGIITVPYNSLVISYEQMDAFAVISIIGAVLKLGIAFILVITPFDRLEFYSLLILLANVITLLLYVLYSKRKFPEVKFSRPKDGKMRKEMISFASWSMIGSTGVMFSNQGQNILLNIFFGPVVNAARAVAVQVCNAVNNLTSNLYQAISPQINKSFASGNIEYMNKLIFASSKYTFYLLFIFILPLIYTGDFILGIWLEEVPERAAIFMYLMLISCIFTALGQPFSNAVGATGNIKKYQLIEGGLQVLTLFVSWLFLLLIPYPEIVFIVHIIMSFIIQIARLVIASPMINLKKKDYCIYVVKPCFLVSLASIALTVFVKLVVEINWISFFVLNIFTVLVIVSAVYFLGLDKSEKVFINNYFLRLVKKKEDVS